MKVVEMQQTQIICGSTKSLYEEELNSSSFIEQ